MTTEKYCPVCDKQVTYTLSEKDYTWRDAAGHLLPVTDQDDRLRVFEMFFNGFFDDETA